MRVLETIFENPRVHSNIGIMLTRKIKFKVKISFFQVTERNKRQGRGTEMKEFQDSTLNFWQKIMVQH